VKLLCLAENFKFSYILVSNFDIKNSELSNSYDFSNLIPLQFPHLYLDKYDDYISNGLKEKEILLSDLTFLNLKSKISYLYDFAIKHYCEFFSNLNDHIYYLGELNEHFKNKFSNLSEEYRDLKIEKDNLISKSKNRTASDLLSEKPKKTDKEYLNEYLSRQMKNHIIHLINVNEKKEDNWEEEFNNLSLYDQENLLNKRNQEALVDKFNYGNKNESENNSAAKKDNANANNNSFGIIEGSAVKLTESLSLCQKLILIAGFCASELPQKYDAKIMKGVKNTGIKKRVKNFFF
jgi:hypothetical protein